MKLNIYYLFLFAGVLAASFSQVLLKKAACRQYGSFIREYLNPYVISGYIPVSYTHLDVYKRQVRLLHDGKL